MKLLPFSSCEALMLKVIGTIESGPRLPRMGTVGLHVAWREGGRNPGIVCSEMSRDTGTERIPPPPPLPHATRHAASKRRVGLDLDPRRPIFILLPSFSDSRLLSPS